MYAALLLGTIMDVYSRAGKCFEIKGSQLAENNVPSSDLIMGLGKRGNLANAMRIFNLVLAENHLKPTVQMFNELIHAWGKSPDPDAMDQAFEVYQRMSEHPKCTELLLKPDATTFRSLLYGLSKSKSTKHGGQKAVELLDEIERRYQAGDTSVKPDVVTYTLAIKACLQVDDVERAEAVLKRMEKSDTPPDVRTYSEILRYWSHIGTLEAAEQAETILMQLKQMAETEDPASIKPNCFTYNITIYAWSRTGYADANERMWRLYEQMEQDGIEPDTVTFNTLVTYLAKSERRLDLERADSLLLTMGEFKRGHIFLDHRHYLPVIKGWITLGDIESAANVLLRTAKNYNKEQDVGLDLNSIVDLVVQAWISLDNLERATWLLAEIQKLKDRNCIPRAPRQQAYKQLLRKWKSSQHPEKENYIRTLNYRIKVNAFARDVL